MSNGCTVSRAVSRDSYRHVGWNVILTTLAGGKNSRFGDWHQMTGDRVGKLNHVKAKSAPSCEDSLI